MPNLPRALPLPHVPRGAVPRRAVLAAAALLASGCVLPQRRDDVPRWRLAADFEPAAAIWLGHDTGHRALTLDLVRALHPHVSLRMLVRDDEAARDAAALLAEAGLAPGAVTVDIDENALFFLRDVAVFAVGGARELAVVDLRWNYYGLPGWCRTRHEDDADAAIACTGSADAARNLLDRRIAELREAAVLDAELTAEGGGIEVNGRGLILANEALVRQRNPGRSRAELEAMHLRLPGIRKVVWLPEGLAEDPLHRATITGPYVGWGTGGHTDEFVRFADARTVLLAWPDDADVRTHPVARLNRARMQRNLEILRQATDADGAPLHVIRVPMPRTIERRVFLSAAALPGWSHEWTADFFPRREGRRQGDAVWQVASASYLNFIVANGVVVLPDYVPHGTPRATQARVRRLFEDAFPGRTIRFVDAIGANWVGGGLHCASLNEPLPPAA